MVDQEAYQRQRAIWDQTDMMAECQQVVVETDKAMAELSEVLQERAEAQNKLRAGKKRLRTIQRWTAELKISREQNGAKIGELMRRMDAQKAAYEKTAKKLAALTGADIGGEQRKVARSPVGTKKSTEEDSNHKGDTTNNTGKEDETKKRCIASSAITSTSTSEKKLYNTGRVGRRRTRRTGGRGREPATGKGQPTGKHNGNITTEAGIDKPMPSRNTIHRPRRGTDKQS